jgi:hypothetical protein
VADDSQNAAFFVDCSCGRRLPVAATAAGSDFKCACGRTVSIPRLSVLRQQAGIGAFESGIPDRIHRLVTAAELPEGSCCAYCGRPTDQVAELRVQIEQLWMRGPGHARYMALLVAMLISPFWWLRAIFFESWREEERRELGRDRFVDTPMRICEEDAPKLRSAGQGQLRSILRTVPIYEELLKEYPKSRIYCESSRP